LILHTILDLTYPDIPGELPVKLLSINRFINELNHVLDFRVLAISTKAMQNPRHLKDAFSKLVSSYEESHDIFVKRINETRAFIRNELRNYTHLINLVEELDSNED